MFLDCKPLCLSNFAFDKLELESSPLTVAILERNRTDVCWQVFVDGSGKFGGIGKPIGYLKGKGRSTVFRTFRMWNIHYVRFLDYYGELYKG